jgi:hypothetical protein
VRLEGPSAVRREAGAARDQLEWVTGWQEFREAYEGYFTSLSAVFGGRQGMIVRRPLPAMADVREESDG